MFPVLQIVNLSNDFLFLIQENHGTTRNTSEKGKHVSVSTILGLLTLTNIKKKNV